MPRVAGKLGRKPFDPERPHLILEKYLDPRVRLAIPGLPAVPLTQDVDRASEVTSWPMYCNDVLECCTISGAGHLFGALTAYSARVITYGAGSEALFSDGEIQQVYSAAGGYVPGDPSTDQGCAMADVLAYLQGTGMTDTAGRVHKAAGYARFGNAADEDLLGQVLEVFGSVYTGINVQASIQQEFADQQPWTWTPGEPVEGGHCVVLQRRLPSSSGAPLEYVTWGALQPATVSFQAYAAEEAWAVVSEDFIRANGTSVDGLDLEQLLADMADV